MNTTAEKELTVEVTEAEYQEGLAKGWTEDDMLRPGTYKVRKATRFRQPVEANEKSKVQITLEVDLDILNHFRQRAELFDSSSYQEQINTELRATMERDKRAELAAIKNLLSDEKFIAAVAEKIAALKAEEVAELEAA